MFYNELCSDVKKTQNLVNKLGVKSSGSRFTENDLTPALGDAAKSIAITFGELLVGNSAFANIIKGLQFVADSEKLKPFFDNFMSVKDTNIEVPRATAKTRLVITESWVTKKADKTIDVKRDSPAHILIDRDGTTTFIKPIFCNAKLGEYLSDVESLDSIYSQYTYLDQTSLWISLVNIGRGTKTAEGLFFKELDFVGSLIDAVPDNPKVEMLDKRLVELLSGEYYGVISHDQLQSVVNFIENYFLVLYQFYTDNPIKEIILIGYSPRMITLKNMLKNIWTGIEVICHTVK